MRLEFGKMKKIKDMSKNEKMKYMFNLLPKYWGEIDENAGIARLQKALYYKTTNGIPIADQLKEIKFDMTVYEDIDQFLFLLTYIILTHSRRKIVSKEELLPNRKLINNIRNVDIDWDITDITVYFYVVGDTYVKIKQEDLINNEEDTIEEFNKHFFFIDRRYEDIDYYQDERAIKQIQQKTQEIFRRYWNVYLVKFELLKTEMNEKEASEQIVKGLEQIAKEGCEESNNREAELYEKAYYDYLNGEEKILYEDLRKISMQNSIVESISQIESILEKSYIKLVNEVTDFEDIVFTYIRCMIFLLDSYRICMFKNVIRDNEKENMQYLFYKGKAILQWLDKLRIKIITTKFNNDIFLHFGTFVYMRYYKRYYEYNKEVLTELSEEVVEKNSCSKIELEDDDMIVYSESYITNSKPKQLLEYFIPDEKERKPSDRNEIKNKLKYTLKVMDELEKKTFFLKEPRYAKYVKIMYCTIYGNYESKYKVDKHMPKKLYQKNIEKIKNSERIILTERDIYERYVNEGKTEEYLDYLNKRRDMLTQCIEMLESVIEMKNDVNGENKIKSEIDDL